MLRPYAVLARFAPAACLLLALGACVGPPADILPTELEVAIESEPYTAQLAAAGLSGDWSIRSGVLPSGLTLDRQTGAISGAALESGTFAFDVAFASSSLPTRSGTISYMLVVLPKLTLSAALPSARVGDAYDFTPTVNGGIPPYVLSVVGLPAGMSFDSQTGRISGTPQNQSAGLTVEVSVSDSGQPQQSQTQRATLVIKPLPVEIATTALPNGRVGFSYSQSVDVENGRPPYTWTVVAGVLPDGLRLNRDSGVISGTPQAAGTATFTIEVVDSDSPSSSAQMQLTIEITP